MRRTARTCAGALCAALGLACLPAHAWAADDEHAHEHAHDEHEDTETIIVTYSPLEHAHDEVALPVDRLDRDDILENLGHTLGETLSNRPGIATTGFASGASRPVIRGQDAFRTGVLEDGLATGDVSRESPDHGVPINPLTAQGIEVVRGPATLRYGGGASAGVVNTITNRVPWRTQDWVSGEIFGAIDTVSNQRAAAFVLDGGLGPLPNELGDFAWHVDGLLRRSDDYDIPNNGSPDTQNGSFADPTAISAGGAYLHDGGRLGFAYSRFENDYGIPEEGEDVKIEMKTDRYRFDGDLNAPLPGIRSVRIRGAYTDYTHDEVAEDEVGQTFDNDEFDGRLEVLHEPLWGFVGAVGLQGRSRDFKAGGEAAEFISDTETRTVAAYFFEERPIVDRLNGEFGLRVESTRVEGTPFGKTRDRDRNFVPVSGSAGLILEPCESWTLGLTGSASQRAPAEVELFARGPHEATGTFEVGDPDFDEETSYSVDLRVDADYGRVRFHGAAFYTYYDDFIYGMMTGRFLDEEGNVVAAGDDEALDELFYDSRDAVFYGTEISAEADLFDALWGTFGVDGRFDFVRARFDDSKPNKNVPRITPIRWGGGAFYRGEWVRARVGFTRTEKQDDTAAFEDKTQDFTMIEASAAVRLSLLDDRVPVELFVAGQNLNDVRGRNHVAFNKDEVLLPGRNVRVGMRASF
ncbi:MAG: TonB-dependent receptor [Myxococcota bacterium]